MFRDNLLLPAPAILELFFNVSTRNSKILSRALFHLFLCVFLGQQLCIDQAQGMAIIVGQIEMGLCYWTQHIPADISYPYLQIHATGKFVASLI